MPCGDPEQCSQSPCECAHIRHNFNHNGDLWQCSPAPAPSREEFDALKREVEALKAQQVPVITYTAPWQQQPQTVWYITVPYFTGGFPQNQCGNQACG